MYLPEELKRMTELGMVQKKMREEKERLEVIASQKRIALEREAKENKEAWSIIDAAEYRLKSAAEDGLNWVILPSIPYDDISLKDMYSREQSNFVCRGATKIVLDKFRERGFAVYIHTTDGPYDPEGPSLDTYHIKISW